MIVTLESGALSLNETAFRRYIYFARGSGRERSRRVQAPAEKAAYSGDRMLRCIWWTERSEVFAETDVAVQRLLGGDDPLWSHDFVLHRLHAESAYPQPVVLLTNAGYVLRRAFLRESTRVAFHELRFRRRNHHFQRRQLRLRPWNRHCYDDKCIQLLQFLSLTHLALFLSPELKKTMRGICVGWVVLSIWKMFA